MEEIRVEVYTTTYCPFCQAAKALLDNKGVKYYEIDITQDANLKKKIMKELGWKTVPIIMINDELIGGYEELRSLEIERKLDQILNIR